MKKITLLLLGLLAMTSASAVENEYVPLVREGVKWVEYYNNSIENTQAVTTYQFSGNIEIGGNIYSKLYASPKVSNVTQDEIPVAYIREQDKVVYCIPVDAMIYGCILSNEDIGEYMIYNFNDITSPYTIEEELISPITTGQMLLGDKFVNLYNLGGTKRIAEGVGCLENVFYDPWPMVMPDGSHNSLAWFEDNGEILFKGEDYDAAMEYLSNQTTFLPVLSEGKSWEVATVKTDSPSDTTGIYDIYVAGDTLVNDITCKKIAIVPKDNQKSSMTAVAYEENGKVWKITEDGTKELLFDMGLDVNDSFDAGYVIKSDIITLNGVSRKRLVIDSGADCDDYLFYVVEGIGISSDKWVFNFGVGNENEYAVMLSCKENGETVFTAEDFKMKNEYVPLVREGVVWEYVGFRQGGDYPRHTLYTLEFQGTTTIDGLLYHNVIRTDYDEQGNAQEPYLVTYVREENKVVIAYKYNEDYYYENYWWCIPKTLYDFNKEMFLPDWSYEDLPESCLPTDYMNPQSVLSIEVEVGGTLRKGYYIDNGNEYYSFKTIEGIGVDCNFGDLLIPYRNYYTGFNPMAGLAAVYENGELVYKGCKYNRAQALKKDVDGDGYVTASDVTAIYNFLLNSSEYDYNEMYDVDGDNMVTAADITAIYNVILGGQ